MKLIDSAQAQNVTITPPSAVRAATGLRPSEVYPIVLGWGVGAERAGRLLHRRQRRTPRSSTSPTTRPTTPSATPASSARPAARSAIGMDSLGNQSTDTSAIQVEAGNTLYIANASVNGSATNTDHRHHGRRRRQRCWLGQDQVGRHHRHRHHRQRRRQLRHRRLQRHRVPRPTGWAAPSATPP